ncbi:F-box only protein 27 isoform X4 [Oryctolagus cuniculus]|uniref:F-box only protein 27 isoform X4 n=1 Tax=Oryctolagus cuniculus TaxID=9986 RepID=UPI003879551F
MDAPYLRGGPPGAPRRPRRCLIWTMPRGRWARIATWGPRRAHPLPESGRKEPGPEAGTMGASASKAPVAEVPAPGPEPEPEPEPELALDLSRLPPELLLLVLSHVPPRALLARCRRVCRGWRALVDGQALWLLILARDGGAAGRALLRLARSCPPPARDAPCCRLGRFCALRPLGRNLIRNPCGQEGLRQWMVQHGGDGWVVEENTRAVPGAPSQTCFVTSFRWCSKKQILDLEEEGLWPELLDSGGIEICVSDWSATCSPASSLASALCPSSTGARTHSSGPATTELA